MKQRMKKIMSVLVTLCHVTGLFMSVGAVKEVHAEDKILDRIEIITPPNKTEYNTLDDFDPDGMVVQAYYKDNSSRILNYRVYNGDGFYVVEPIEVTANDSYVTLSYTENGVTKTTTQAITVNDRGGLQYLVIINVGPTKTEYHEGEQFDPAGMAVLARYADQSIYNINDYMTIEPAGALTVSDQYVTISFTDGGVTKTITQNITVSQSDVTLGSISISTPPTKTVYEVGDFFDVTGMVVMANWSDNTSTPITNYTYSPVGQLSKNDTEITLNFSFGGVTKTTTQAIEFNALDRIEIITPPNKTEYNTLDDFDPDGMVVQAYYKDNSSRILNYRVYNGDGFYVVEPIEVTANDSYVTLSYTENGVTKTTTQAITVNDRGGLQYLEINVDPTKTEYHEGEQFDPAGMAVLARYADQSIHKINDYMTIEPAGALTVSDQYVTISFTDGGVTKTITQNIGVSPVNVTLDSISISTAPTKTVYEVGDFFDVTGMVVMANWSDNTSAPITNYTYSPVGQLSKNDTEITLNFSFGGVTKTTTQAIEFNALDRIEIITPPNKTEYNTLDDFDPDGMVVQAYYKDNSSRILNYSIYNGDGLYVVEPIEVTANDSYVTLSYTENGVTTTTTQAITVNDRGGLDYIYIETSPAKTEYIAGEQFDPTGMEVIVVYNDGHVEQVTKYIAFEPAGALAVTDHNVIISFTDGNATKTITHAIGVIPSNADIVSIYIDTPSDKKIYEVGELFDKTGMVVKAKWSDGTITELNNFQYAPTGQLSDKDNKITVSYNFNNETKTATQDIVFRTIDSIVITTPPTKTAYEIYEYFDKTGMVVTAKWNDDSTEVITTYTCTPKQFNSVTDTEVTVSYTDKGITKTAKQVVTVKALDSISIITPPDKTTYMNGDSFEKTGMVVAAKYSDNSTVEIKDYTIAPIGSLKTTDTSITISYTEKGITKTVTQEITVTAVNSGNNGTENSGSGNAENNNSGNSGTENNGSGNTGNNNSGNSGSENNNSGNNSGSNSGNTNTGNNNSSNTGSNTGNNSGSNSGNSGSGSTYIPVSTPTPTPEVPGTTTKEVKNADGSKTTTTRTLEESGKVTETTVKESKNGDKTSTEVVTDASGKIVSTIIETKTTNKSGTTTVSTTEKKADGSLSYSSVETYKSGKVVSKINETNADKSKKTVEETKQADGSTTKTVTKVGAGGSAKMTVTSETPVADDKEAKKTEFVYSMTESGKAKLVKVTTDEAEITIPATVTINGIKCKVVTIGKSAFKGNTSITKIVVGKYVETIGTKAFAGLKDLNEISISSSKLSKVSKSAFYKISKDAKFYIKAKKSACKAIAALITKSGVKKVNYERVK